MCADLILQGYPAFPVAAGLPYDVIVEACGSLLRLQVKATLQEKPTPQRAVRTPTYQFAIRRCGSGGRRQYSASDCDGYALVALDTRHIAYLPFSAGRATIHLRVPGVVPARNATRMQTIADYSWEAFLDAVRPQSVSAEVV